MANFNAVSLAIAVGAGLFKEFHDSYPDNLQTLCDSPYIPVRCGDLKLDPRGKPLSVALRDPDPWARLLKSSDPRSDYTLQLLIKSPPNRMLRPPHLLSTKAMNWKEIRNRLKPEERTALSVTVMVDALQDEYKYIFFKYPKDFASLRASFPGIVPVLRNEFNGSYARVVDKPSPGDLVVKRLPVNKDTNSPYPRKRFYVAIYGRSGPIEEVTEIGWWLAGGYEVPGEVPPQ